MKKLSFHIILLLSHINNSYSQVRFSMPSPGEIGKQVIEYDSCYLTINNGLENNYWKLFVHKISKSGDSLDFWKINADTNARNFVWSPVGFAKKRKKQLYRIFISRHK